MQEQQKPTASQALTTSPLSRAVPAQETSFFNVSGFELMQRVASAFSKSSLVPKEYQNNVPNCMIALSIADRVGSEPLMVMQNLVVVHGRPTWSAQFLIATANACGRFTAVRFEFFGTANTDSWGCRAWAVEKSTQEKLVGSDVTIAIAKKEGWYSKQGSKWQTIPQQMLMYRAGSWWVRAYAPELSLGLHTADEAIDVLDASRRDDGGYSVDLQEARDQIGEQDDSPLPEMSSAEEDQHAASSNMIDRMIDRAIEEMRQAHMKTDDDLKGLVSMMRGKLRSLADQGEINATSAEALGSKLTTAYLERLREISTKKG